MSLSNPNLTSSTVNPIAVINGYLWSSFKEIDPGLAIAYTINGKEITPIFPISDSMADNMAWTNKAYLLYNSVYSRPAGPFYPIKRESIYYALKGNAGQTFEWSRAIQKVLDRQDDAARDANEWNRNNLKSPVFFHNLRVFQAGDSKTRDYVVKPFYYTDIMVRAEYHFNDSV